MRDLAIEWARLEFLIIFSLYPKEDVLKLAIQSTPPKNIRHHSYSTTLNVVYFNP